MLTTDTPGFVWLRRLGLEVGGLTRACVSAQPSALRPSLPNKRGRVDIDERAET
jgi:hypothetical protein